MIDNVRSQGYRVRSLHRIAAHYTRTWFLPDLAGRLYYACTALVHYCR